MEPTSNTAIELGRQLALAGGLALVLIMVHAAGLLAIYKLFGLGSDRLKKRNINFRTLLMLGGLGSCIFALHLFEILIFAGFYMGVGALPAFDEALYYSASAYATLGRSTDYFPEDWRLVGAIQALIGFILIGWSTALMVSAMRKLAN